MNSELIVADQSSSHLTISLLGEPKVTLPDENAASFGVDKGLLLLAYLSLSPANSHRRSELAALFYPDSDDSQALQNLRQTFFRLRQSVGDKQADPSYFLATAQQIQFNPDSRYWVDVAEFESLIEATKKHNHRHLEVCQSCIAKLERAVRLYRSDFLQGISIDTDSALSEWVLLTRDDLRYKAVEALHVLGNYSLQRRLLDNVEDYAARLLAIDALDEPALCLQMQVLALKGRRNQALLRYREFKHRLAEILEIEPEPETVELAQNIANGQAWRELPPGRNGKLTRPQRPRTLLTAQSLPDSALPNTLLPFIGREEEMNLVFQLLASQDCRLITLVGLGGSGKTRLAMRAAAEDAPNWSDGAWIAWLRDISGASSLEETLAQALGIPITNPDQASFQLKAFLREKELLLVLDNFEQVENGAGLVKSLLFYAPQIKIIITSRSRLGIRGEQVVEVRGLSYPSDYELDASEVFQNVLEEGSQRYSAIELFVENARRVSPKFRLSRQNVWEVIRICQLVDGFPLGLELAAGWTSVFPCDEIVRRIEQNVDFLKATHRDVPPRQSSIRAVFEYSWDLLSEEERDLLERLAVFPNTFSTEAALNIAGARPAPMASLCDKFVLRIHSKERFEIHPLLRSYAAEKLDQKASLAREIKDLHSSYYLAWLKDCTALLQKTGRMLVTQPSQQSINLGDLEDELGNLCQAWQWTAMNGRLEDLRRSVEGLTYLYTLNSTPQADKGALQTAAVQTAIEHLFSLLDTNLCQQLPDSEQLADLRHTLRWLMVMQSDFYTAESNTVPVEEDSYLVKQVPSQTDSESMDTSTGMPIYSIFS